MNFSQCDITPSQVEEIFRKSPNDELFSSFSDSDLMRKGEKWFFRTKDTGRFAEFKWRAVRARIIPPAPDKASLFDSAMKALRIVAVKSSLLLAQYERFADNYASVFVVDAPLKLLREFIQSQRKMDEWELAKLTDVEDKERAEDKRVRSEWPNSDTYTQYAGALVTVRQLDLPNMIIYSLTDQSYFVAVFRDWKPTDGVVWPIYAHDPAYDAPCDLCENPSCTQIACIRSDSTYAGHVGPLESRMRALHRTSLQSTWRDEYAPQAESEIERSLAEQGGECDSEAIRLIAEPIYARYEAMMVAEKDSLFREKIWGGCTVPMLKCSGCHLVQYCSKECQREDRRRHREMCQK